MDLAATYGLANLKLAPTPGWPLEFARLILIGRLVAVALAVGTVLLTYLTARRLYGRRPAWLAALFLAVAPMHVVLAHYMAVDVPMTFFTALCLMLSARALPRAGGATPWSGWPRFVRRWLALGGAAGLAAGTKYTGGVILAAALVPLTAIYPPWRRRPSGSEEPAQGLRESPSAGGPAKGGTDQTPQVPPWLLWLAGGALLGIGAAVAFLASTPGMVVEWPKFARDFAEELEHSRTGHGNVFRFMPPAGLYHATVSLPVAFGWPLYLLALAGAAWAAWRRRPADWLLLAAVIPLYALLSRSELRFLRYVVPLLPPLAILAARAVVSAAAAVERRRTTQGARRSKTAPGVLAGLTALTVLPALGSSLAHDAVMAGEDPRERAARWLLATTPPGATIALASNPWFYTPPLDPSAGCVTWAMRFGGPPVWEQPAPQSGRKGPEPVPVGSIKILAQHPPGLGFEPEVGPLPVEALRRDRPLRVVVSDYESADAERVGRLAPGDRDTAGIRRVLEELGRDYVLERTFTVRPRLGPFAWFQGSEPPHDWGYFMPTIQVYRRKE